MTLNAPARRVTIEEAATECELVAERAMPRIDHEPFKPRS